jgi:hypothetical protein
MIYKDYSLVARMKSYIFMGRFESNLTGRNLPTGAIQVIESTVFFESFTQSLIIFSKLKDKPSRAVNFQSIISMIIYGQWPLKKKRLNIEILDYQNS